MIPLNKKSTLLIVKILIALSTLSLLFQKIEVSQMEYLVEKIPLSLILVSIGIELLRIFLVSLRWKSLTYAPPQFSIFEYFRLSLIGITSTLIMPGSLGGDGVRVALVIKKVKEKAAHTFAILFDRVIGLFSITLFALFSLIFFETSRGKNMYLTVSLSSAILILVLIFIVLSDTPYKVVNHCFKRWKSLSDFFNKLRAGALFYKNKPILIIKAILLSLFIHLISIIICFLFSQKLEIDCSFATFMVVVPIVWIITAVPLSFGGLGVREWSFVGLLSYQAVEPEKAVTLSLLLFLLTIITGFFGIPYIFLSNSNKT